MFIRQLFLSLRPYTLVFCLCNLSFYAHADGFAYSSPTQSWSGSDEDTILIEDQSDAKLSYSQAIKAACKNLLGFDIDQYFSTGKNKRSDVIKQLNDLAERTHYRLRLDKEEVTLNFTLNL